MAFRDYSLTPASNTALSDGTYIGPNMLRNKVRPAFQQIAADGKALALELDEGLAGVALGLDNSGVVTEVLRVNLARYGLREAGTAAQNLTAINDAIGEHGGGTHRVWLDMSPGNYTIDDIGVSVPNIGIHGHGSTIIGGRLTASPAATGFGLDSLNFYTDTTSAVLTLNGSNSVYNQIGIEKFGAGDGYMAMFEGPDACTFTNWRLRNGDGLFCETTNSLFNAFDAIARPGGDDFFALKARNRENSGNVFGNILCKGFSAVFSFGSEIGTLGAASSSRAGRVVGNKGRNILAVECAYGIYEKAGAIDNGAAYDWRDGYVSDNDFEVKVYDPRGVKFLAGIVSSASRGALSELNRFVVTGKARAADNRGSAWLSCYIPDYSASTPAAAAPTIRKNEYRVDVSDPLNGAGNLLVGGDAATNLATQGVAVTAQPYNLRFRGLGTITLSGAYTSVLVGTGADDLRELTFTPSAGTLTLTVSTAGGSVLLAHLKPASQSGFPVMYVGKLEKQTAGHGTMADNQVWLKGNGSRESGLQIGASVTGTVIEQADLENCCTGPTSTAFGINALSAPVMEGEYLITMASATYKPIGPPTADIIGRRMTIDISAAAGVDADTFRQMPHDTWLRKASGVSNNSVGTSGVYLTLELRAVNGLNYDGTALDGNALTTFSTQVTATTQFVPFDFPALPTVAGGPFEDRFLKAGAVLRLIKRNTGGGQPFTGPVDIHYVQLGPRV